MPTTSSSRSAEPKYFGHRVFVISVLESVERGNPTAPTWAAPLTNTWVDACESIVGFPIPWVSFSEFKGVKPDFSNVHLFQSRLTVGKITVPTRVYVVPLLLSFFSMFIPVSMYLIWRNRFTKSR
jgi:hypothetical protein